MEGQIDLPINSLNILLGPPPEVDTLKLLHTAFRVPPPHEKFKQVIVLSSQKLVQLCNFIRRVRLEQAQHRNNKYLVFLHFFPHREAWDLLSKYESLGITLVLFGGICTSHAIRELLPLRPHSLLEWYKHKIVGNKPVFCCITAQGRVGAARTLDNITSLTQDFSAEVAETVTAWRSVRPIRAPFRPEDFASMDTFRNQGQEDGHTSSRTKSSEQHTTAAATSTMNIAKACEILEITEAQSKDLAAIKKAYRKMAVKWHPDKHPEGDARISANEKFVLVNEAWTYFEALFTS